MCIGDKMAYELTISNGKKVTIEDSVIKSVGIELEGNFMLSPRVANDLRREFSELDIGRDGTIVQSSNDEYNDNAYELKYWVYNRPENMENMDEFLEAAYDHSTSFNISCGLHIHFEMRNDVVSRDGDCGVEAEKLKYLNVKKYILSKYTHTYLPEIADKFDIVLNSLETAYEKGDMEYTWPMNYRDIEKRVVKILNDALRKYDFDIDISDIMNRANRQMYKVSDIYRDDFSPEVYRLLKYGSRLINTYTEYVNDLRFISDRYSHYGFINIYNSYSAHGNYEFRLMPYADNAGQAMEHIIFFINTLSEAVNKLEKMELDGCLIDDALQYNVEYMSNHKDRVKRKRIIKYTTINSNLVVPVPSDINRNIVIGITPQ